ncbi:MAG TPA: HAMP domain-containing sensor histidine kinase [Acidimicrobiia bacterium]|nr:HAMP domain-containing sensor histidine kinase [Acidimicrobiia bacterium]
MPARSRRALLTIFLWVAYVGTWPLGHGSFINDVYAVMAFAPLLAGAWFFGWSVALVLSLGYVPLQMTLFLTTDHSLGWDALAGRGGAAGIGVMILVTLFVGWASDSNRRMRRLLATQAELVAVVSHEVRTPLTGVLGMSQELRQSWPSLSDDTKRELVDLIAESADDMSSIVEDLLTAASAEQDRLVIHPDVTDLGSLAEGVVEQVGVTVPVTGEALAWADPARTRQVIRNLVINASRYGGSPITMQVGGSGSQVFLEVADKGPGIPADKLATLFMAHTADHRHPDSHGLGLALSHRLATLMGGDLTYQRVGERSVFRLSLPRAVIPAPHQALQVRVGR